MKCPGAHIAGTLARTRYASAFSSRLSKKPSPSRSFGDNDRPLSRGISRERNYSSAALGLSKKRHVRASALLPGDATCAPRLFTWTRRNNRKATTAAMADQYRERGEDERSERDRDAPFVRSSSRRLFRPDPRAFPVSRKFRDACPINATAMDVYGGEYSGEERYYVQEILELTLRAIETLETKAAIMSGYLRDRIWRNNSRSEIRIYTTCMTVTTVMTLKQERKQA